MFRSGEASFGLMLCLGVCKVKNCTFFKPLNPKFFGFLCKGKAPGGKNFLAPFAYIGHMDVYKGLEFMFRSEEASFGLLLCLGI